MHVGEYHLCWMVTQHKLKKLSVIGRDLIPFHTSHLRLLDISERSIRYRADSHRKSPSLPLRLCKGFVEMRSPVSLLLIAAERDALRAMKPLRRSWAILDLFQYELDGLRTDLFLRLT